MIGGSVFGWGRSLRSTECNTQTWRKGLLYGLHLIFLTYPIRISDYFNILRNGGTGFRGSDAPPVGAGRPGAPSRLADRSLGPRLCPARRSLPAGEILPFAHTDGPPLRSVKHCATWVFFLNLLLLLFYFKSHERSSWVVFVLAAAATYTHLKAWLHFFFSIMLRPKACPCSTGCERLLCGCTKLMVMFFGGGGIKERGTICFKLPRCGCLQSLTVQISANDSVEWRSGIFMELNQHF